MIEMDIHTYCALFYTHAYRPSYFPFRNHYTGSIEKPETKVGVKYLKINVYAIGMYIFEVVSHRVDCNCYVVLFDKLKDNE